MEGISYINDCFFNQAVSSRHTCRPPVPYNIFNPGFLKTLLFFWKSTSQEKKSQLWLSTTCICISLENKEHFTSWPSVSWPHFIVWQGRISVAEEYNASIIRI